MQKQAHLVTPTYTHAHPWQDYRNAVVWRLPKSCCVNLHIFLRGQHNNTKDFAKLPHNYLRFIIRIRSGWGYWFKGKDQQPIEYRHSLSESHLLKMAIAFCDCHTFRCILKKKRKAAARCMRDYPAAFFRQCKNWSRAASAWKCAKSYTSREGVSISKNYKKMQRICAFWKFICKITTALRLYEFVQGSWGCLWGFSFLLLPQETQRFFSEMWS